MRLLGNLVFCFGLILSSADVACAQGWEGIVPLKSVRADVERLLGASVSNVYHYRDKIVSVEYAQFPCFHENPTGWPDAPPGWDVPPNTVVAIRVSFRNKPVPLASLYFDLSKFQKERGDSDLSQHFYYTNKTEGFAIEFFDFGGKRGAMAQSFIYMPTSKEAEIYRCEK